MTIRRSYAQCNNNWRQSLRVRSSTPSTPALARKQKRHPANKCAGCPVLLGRETKHCVLLHPPIQNIKPYKSGGERSGDGTDNMFRHRRTVREQNPRTTHQRNTVRIKKGNETKKRETKRKITLKNRHERETRVPCHRNTHKSYKRTERTEW